MSRKLRLLSAISAVTLFLASCGGGDTSSRTKNSALCYATQEEKDAAVQAARDAFDAVMAGNLTDDSVPTDSTVVTDSTVITEDTDSSDVTISENPEAFGGGYRRPAVRAASSGDTTVPPAGDGGTLTPEQQQAQMDLEAAESQPLCDSNETSSEVSCEITLVLGGENTSTCPEVTINFTSTVSTDALEWEAVVGELVVASGTWNAEAESTKVVAFTYTPLQEESSDTTVANESDSPCTATFNSTGISWNCSDGSLFNAAIEDMSNPGVYPLVECSASGSFTVAENQQFWFNFSLGETFFDGYNNNQEQNVAIDFTVPEDTEGVCIEEEIDWDSLPFSGQSEIQTRHYSFSVPEGFDEPVYVRFESSSYFDIDISSESDFVEDPCEGECESYVGLSIWELEPGEYQFETDDNQDVVTWTSNVEISAAPRELPELPFSESFDGALTTYSFTIDEPQSVIIWASAGQTCLPSEDDEGSNGFADPELRMYGPNDVETDDDNDGRSAGNCSASLIEEDLEAGTYFLEAEDDDLEGFEVTVYSNVELTPMSLSWKPTTVTVVGQMTIEFVVPEGGAFFQAQVLPNQTVIETYAAKDFDSQLIAVEGCANPDNDLETWDYDCIDAQVRIIDGDREWQSSCCYEESSWSQKGSVWLRTANNFQAQRIKIFLEAGTYVMSARAMTWNPETNENETVNEAIELRYGLISASDFSQQELKVVEIENNEIPVDRSISQLPVGSLTEGSQVSTALSETVNEFVCNSACIDDLFAKAGFSDGSMVISAGGESVKVRKGQGNVRVPVGSDADRISVTATSADGSQVVTLSSGIAKVSDSLQKTFNSKQETSASGSAFNLLYLLLLIPILGAVLFVIRRKQTVSISQ